MGRPLSRPRKPAAHDRAADLAQTLMEDGMRLPIGSDGRIVPGSFRHLVDSTFPGISHDEVTRGVLIAIQLAKMDRGLR